jgi:hypothetical protein
MREVVGRWSLYFCYREYGRRKTENGEAKKVKGAWKTDVVRFKDMAPHGPWGPHRCRIL